MTIERMYHSIRLFLLRSERKKAEYLKSHHILGGVGNNCKWGPWLVPLYPELIILHDNVCVHKTAHIVVHDMINVFLKNSIQGAVFGGGEVLGPVEIDDNVYISMNAMIMPNVKIGKNCIVSAGSIVSDDVPDNSIVAGNPAKVIGRFDAYAALRRMSASKNKPFPNQHLPRERAEQAWEQFNKKHDKSEGKK